MKTWYAVFVDNPQSEVTYAECDDNSDALERFAAAARIGKIGDREVLGMWIIDHATEFRDVLRVHGHVPEQIRNRYEIRMWQMRGSG